MKIKILILNFAAEAAIPHFRGVFMGSHVHLKKRLKPREFAHPDYQAEPKMDMKPS